MLDVISFYALGAICAVGIALLLPLVLANFKGMKTSFGLTFVIAGIVCYFTALAVFYFIDHKTGFMLYVIERNMLNAAVRIQLLNLIICFLIFGVSACMLPLFGGWRNAKIPLGIALLLHMLFTLQPVYYVGIKTVIEKNLTGGSSLEAVSIYALGVICFVAIALLLRILVTGFSTLEFKQGARFSAVGVLCCIAGLAFFVLLNILIPFSQLTQIVAVRYYALVFGVSGIIYLVASGLRVLLGGLRNSNVPLCTGLLLHLLLCLIPIVFIRIHSILGLGVMQ